MGKGGWLIAIEVRVPNLLQGLVSGAKSVRGQGSTVGELLDYLESQYAGIKARVVTQEGKLHPFIHVYLNDEDIRFLGELQTPLSDGDVISILPAISGGRTAMIK